MELVVAAALFLMASAALVCVALRDTRDRDAVLARLRRGGTGASYTAGGSPPISTGNFRRELIRHVSRLSPTFKAEKHGPLRTKLIEAGFRSPAAAVFFMGARIALTLGLTFAAFSLAAMFLPPDRWMLVSAPSFVFGYLAPSVALNILRRRRQQEIFRTLPSALDLLIVCVESGLGLSAALQRVSDEQQSSAPVLSSELGLAVLETQAGKTLSAALRSMSERCAVDDLTSFVNALIQTERLGTQIADTLRVQSESMRNKRLRLAEEAAQKAPVKMLFPALFIFSSMLIVALGPAFFRFKDTFVD